MASPVFYALIFIFIPLICNGQQNIGNVSKSELIEVILQKVLNLTLASFSNIPDNEREKMMIKIEAKLNKSAQSLGQSNGKYVALIMEGVRSMTQNQQWAKYYTGNTKASVNNVLEDNNDHQDMKNIELVTKKQAVFNNQNVKFNRGFVKPIFKTNNKKTTHTNEARRMEFEFIDSINVSKHVAPQSSGYNKEKIELNNFAKDGNEIDNIINDNSVTLQLPCHNENKITCNNIKKLSTIECNNREISVEKLCDGINDCFDYSDERNCAKQGAEKVRNASLIISDIERSLTKKCFSPKVDDSLIRKQNEILHDVLQRQLEFIEKHTTDTNSNVRRSNTESQKVKKTVNEVANVLNTLSSGLESTLCSSTDEYRKFYNIDKDLDMEMLDTSTWAPSVCTCVEEYCVEECQEDCKSVCRQKYSLARWQCKAVDGKATITLDLLCDGKIDCFDEGDENKCNSGVDHTKFEAAEVYSMILELISKKTQSSSFIAVQKKFANLQRSVEKLQKLSMVRKVDVPEVKAMRDQCFSELVAIYEYNKYYAVSMAQVNDMFAFLMSLNEQLAMALKLSHSGNVRLIAHDDCFCRDGNCALMECSKTCIRACAAESKLTRYRCAGSTNISLPVESICNGTNECPSGDDEKDCSKEVICRRHHLIVLRHDLESHNPDEGKSGTSVGEAIKSWKTKVSATLRIANSYDRPAPKIIRDIVNEILHDLVMCYAGLDVSFKTRRSNEDVINQFYEMSVIVMNTLKSCGK